MLVMVGSNLLKLKYLNRYLKNMETDKENVQHSYTKIPLPMEPLPALPKYLLSDVKYGEKVQQRCPLKTINYQTTVTAGPSKVKVIPNKSENIRIDTNNLTLRNRRDDYKIFPEEKADGDAVTIFSNNDFGKGNKRVFVDSEKNAQLGEIKKNSKLVDGSSAVTPTKVCLESNRVKNIKKSLKRPHSRELQGISPLDTQEKHDDNVNRRLQFNQNVGSDFEAPDYWQRSYLKCMNRDYTAEVFDYLLNAEERPLAVPRSTSVTRACVINWLMKVNGSDGNPATIQTACWYLDSILGTANVQLEKMQLVAAACYWIAQKLHGPVVCSTRLVKCSNCAFTTAQLLAAEKAILLRLKFPRQPVVAQEFITYLAWWCDHSHPEDIETAATFLCMSGLMVDKVLCEELPSVIAAAAVRNTLLLLGRKSLVAHLQMCPVYESAEKKAVNLSFTCSVLRRAVRTVSAAIYEYKTPLEHYGMPPRFIAYKIVCAANELSLFDVRNIDQGIYFTKAE